MNLAELLQAHPWPAEYLAKGSPLDWVEQFHIDAPRHELWPVLMDTSRFNRFMGLPEMKYEEREGVMYGSTRNAGILMEWKEIPWSWTSESSMTNAREYSKGIGHFLRAVYVLTPAGTGTDVTIYFGWIPRNFFMRLLLILARRSFWSDYRSAFQKIEKMLQASRGIGPLLTARRETEIPEAVRIRLSEVKERLKARGVPETLFDRLVDHVLHGDDLDLYRIRALALASLWQEDPRQVLRLCLHAAREGILTISWDVICPHCRGVRQEISSLGDMPKQSSCDACEIEFENNTENSIEITFHVHPSIRQVPRVFFCSAEPARKAHIKLQQYLRPGESMPASLALEEGKYRLRVKGANSAGSLVVTPGQANSSAHLPPLQWSADAGSIKLESSTDLKLTLVNPTSSARVFTLEKNDWDRDTLKPAMIFNLQEFHDLFSAEYISLDLQLELGEQAILFTDMVGSTKFYAAAGDSKAFALVKRHFEEVYQKVREGNGAVIKTIGDAVMAAFSDPLDAMKTAVVLQKTFREGREDTPIRLRVSVHAGPCIGVNLNSGIDYFGTTVNVAAKLQSLASAQEIVFSDRVLQSPGISAWLRANQLTPAEVRQVVDGVGEVPAHRIQI
jgi:class 3 adenylate cyclase